MSLSPSALVPQPDSSDPEHRDADGADNNDHNNAAAFSHNATFPPTHTLASALPDQVVLPAFSFRKPSTTGLQVQTDLSSQANERNPDDSNGASAGQGSRTKEVPGPLKTRGSWDSQGGSPSSTASSPAFAALGDVTPLPSPIGPAHSLDVWKKVAGRPHSGSSASVEREKLTGFLSPATSSPQRKKRYGPLGGTPPSASNDETNGAPDRTRALSEFVPDVLQNVRPRVVTGPTPPDTQDENHPPAPPLHRELHYAKQRLPPPPTTTVAQIDSLDSAQTLPSIQPSTLRPSGAGYDGDQSLLDTLTISDTVTRRTTHWNVIRRLGNGSFSEVVLATNDPEFGRIDSGTDGAAPSKESLVAIKIVSHTTSNDEERMDTSIKREIEILQSISHPCLPRLYAFEDNQTHALLVLNYCPGGDLFDFASQRRDSITPKLIERIFAELVAAVSYLHERLICHRDIKLENVLLGAAFIHPPADPTRYPHPLVTLTDLGLSKHIPPPPSSPLLTHPCGSVDYAAPEVLLGQPYDGRATDAWALGVLLYALMEGRLPFDAIPRGKRRGPNNVKHRIARCDWLWCEYGDDYGDWSESAPRALEMQGAREVVEGLLKKVGRGRWPLDKVQATKWVRDGIQIEGGLQFRS